MQIRSIDHLVLCVRDVATACAFYERVLGMEVREERPGKFALHFGANKISLQDASTVPEIARATTPGSGNFCLLSDSPIERVRARLAECGVAIVEGPVERIGATGPIVSIYFRDPDGNLVEVSNTRSP